MKVIFIFILFSINSHAADSGSIKDLVPYIFNFSVLFLILIWKLKKPISKYFKDFSKEIEGKIETAAIRSREAELLLSENRKKLDNIEDEVEKINIEYSEMFSRYSNQIEAETKAKIDKLEQDTFNKIKFIQEEMKDKLKKEAVRAISAKTIDNIKNNKEIVDDALSSKLAGVK